MILGITGISGSGKHTIAYHLAKKGWVILDADKIAHDLYRPYSGVWKAVATEFGEKILNQDDTINREKLSQIVFNRFDPEASEKALNKLNAIVHPYIRRFLEREIHYHHRRHSSVAIVVALWQAIDLPQLTDRIILVTAKEDLRRERIQKRDGISGEIYAMRIKNQIEPPAPDLVLENNGAKEEVFQRLEEWIGQ